METKGAMTTVKGISRQVIVVHAPDRKLFEQAIFILREDASEEGITDEMLLREARMAVRRREKGRRSPSGAIWALIGALSTGAVWLLTSIL